MCVLLYVCTVDVALHFTFQVRMELRIQSSLDYTHVAFCTGACLFPSSDCGGDEWVPGLPQVCVRCVWLLLQTQALHSPGEVHG